MRIAPAPLDARFVMASGFGFGGFLLLEHSFATHRSREALPYWTLGSQQLVQAEVFMLATCIIQPYKSQTRFVFLLHSLSIFSPNVTIDAGTLPSSPAPCENPDAVLCIRGSASFDRLSAVVGGCSPRRWPGLAQRLMF